MLVELTTITGEADQGAGASRYPDLVCERNDRLHARDRDPAAPLAMKLDERDCVRLGDDQGAPIAGDLELTRMDHRPHAAAR